jgi:hypothetical protein
MSALKMIFTERLGLAALFNLAASIFLLSVPYYYFLGKQHYIPKSNPDLGYFLPNSFEAWFFLILALVFFGLFWVTFALFYRKIRSKGLVLAPGIDLD